MPIHVFKGISNTSCRVQFDNYPATTWCDHTSRFQGAVGEWAECGASGGFVYLFVVVLRHGNSVSDIYCGGDMMYEMRRRNPEFTSLPTQGIFNLPHHICMV